ncbi:uncharacterized protein LOC142532527 [Primulina tabacum]|uniref:uncharacterized protein LOC142532527 n=1 Tax=Primulina tabacum TaxID=48773 RepID=UPI003F59C3F8
MDDMPIPTLRNGKPGLLFPEEFMPRGFLILTLACEEDYAFFWTKGIMHVGPLSIHFSKWTPEFNLQEESPIAPVWIRFSGLPLHLFSKKSLFALDKILGKPVKMDDHTTDSSRGAFARVCVEMNVFEPPVKEVWVGWGDHAQEIEIIYERIPGYCMDCKMLSTSVCYSHGKNPKHVRPKPADRAPDTEHDPVGLDFVDANPPSGHMEAAGVGPSGEAQFETVLNEGVGPSGGDVEEGACNLNQSCHSIPSVPPSTADASSMVEELVARQGPSVSELVFRLESAEDTDQEFDRHSEAGDGCRSEGRAPDSDMSDIKKIKENAFHKSCKKRQGDFSARSPQLWDSLLQVKPDQGPWLVGGDFNVVRNASDCLGSSGGRLLPMEEFNHFILDSGIVDAGFEGSSFTWTDKIIWKHLDRVSVSVDWGDHFHSIRVKHLCRTVSDHCPLFVSIPVFVSDPSFFRFQSMWIRHHGFLQTVRLNWNLPCHLNGMHRLFVKLKRLKSHLKWWNKSIFGNLFAKLAEAEQAVRLAEEVCEAHPSELHWTRFSNCNADLARVTTMEVDFWR